MLAGMVAAIIATGLSWRTLEGTLRDAEDLLLVCDLDPAGIVSPASILKNCGIAPAAPGAGADDATVCARCSDLRAEDNLDSRSATSRSSCSLVILLDDATAVLALDAISLSKLAMFSVPWSSSTADNQ